MATKYIINNLTGQTIDGNLTINDTLTVNSGFTTAGDIDVGGNINVVGTINSIATYKALMTQTGSLVGTAINNFNGAFTIGETYTVNTYESGDDFSNVADVQNGGILTFTYSGTGAVDLTNTYFSVTSNPVTGTGSGAEFDVVVNSGVYESVTIANNGYGYVVGDIMTIRGIFLGGDGTNDITVTITSLTPNSSGSVFIATGSTPTIWSFGSQLTSGGGLIVNVLENTLGYDISWQYGNGLPPGNYVGSHSVTGPIFNSFPRNKVKLFSEINPFNDYGYGRNLRTYGGSGSLTNTDDVIYFGVYDWGDFFGVDDSLYYTPIEINIQQDLDETPITISGFVASSYSFTNVSVDLFCGGSLVETFYSNGQLVNNLSELVAYLNTDPTTSYLGTYSYDESDNIFLTMKTNLKNQFCSSNTLTFEVFND